MSRPRPLRRRLAAAVLASLLVLAGCADGPPADPPPDQDQGPSPGPTALEPTVPEPTAPGPTATDERPVPPEEVAPFGSGDELAAALATAEAALAAPETPEEHRDRWAWVHQQAYRDLAANPDWVEAARAAVPAARRDAFDLTLTAVRKLRAMTSPQPAPPARWRIVAPTSLDELRDAYAAAEETTGAPAEVLAAINLVETRFGRIRGDSTAGAQGPMQFMPATWAAYGEGDVSDPHDAIAAAGRYLADHGAPDDLRSAVYAYNHSERYVDAVLAHAAAIAGADHHLDVLHRWRVHYRTVDGDVLLEEGWGG